MADKYTSRGYEWERKDVSLESLRYNRDLQPREEPLIEKVVLKYARDMAEGAIFPPIQVARIGRSLFVLDGHHRVAAAGKAGLKSLRAEVATMTQDQADLYALGTNNTHGASLNRKDRKRILQQYVKRGFHLRRDKSVKSASLIEREINKTLTRPTITVHLRKMGIEPGSPQDDGFEHKEWTFEDRTEDEEPEALTQPELLADIVARLEAIELLTDQLEDDPTIEAAWHSVTALAQRLRNRFHHPLDI